jgi:hypothetical protein
VLASPIKCASKLSSPQVAARFGVAAAAHALPAVAAFCFSVLLVGASLRSGFCFGARAGLPAAVFFAGVPSSMSISSGSDSDSELPSDEADADADCSVNERHEPGREPRSEQERRATAANDIVTARTICSI